ncbi:hypothetical protein ASG43_19125 [Aureimonas sp. Leaf454]|nr:hypothetical protein ASG43_19125 [Aureimonas sp. Leaf454]
MGSCAVASAAVGTINFTGNVAATCSLSVTNGSAIMTPSSNLQTLSSKNGGGTAGTVAVTTTGGVVLGVDAASSLIQPTGDVTATTWTPSYSLSGVSTVSDTSLPSTISSPGTGTINVNLTGTKSGINSFVTGSYSAVVTVRCEP